MGGALVVCMQGGEWKGMVTEDVIADLAGRMDVVEDALA